VVASEHFSDISFFIDYKIKRMSFPTSEYYTHQIVYGSIPKSQLRFDGTDGWVSNNVPYTRAVSSGTIAVPEGANYVVISAMGGGGGGGHAFDGGFGNFGGGGGGSGNGIFGMTMKVEYGETFVVTIGAGGLGGDMFAPGNGGTGGTTTIVTPNSGTITVTGGTGGIGGTSGTNTNGGSGHWGGGGGGPDSFALPGIGGTGNGTTFPPVKGFYTPLNGENGSINMPGSGGGGVLSIQPLGFGGGGGGPDYSNFNTGGGGAGGSSFNSFDFGKSGSSGVVIFEWF